MKLELLLAVDGFWKKAEVTVEVFLGRETSSNGEESSVILFQKFSFSGPPDLGVDVDEGGYWNPVVDVSRLFFLFPGVLKPKEDGSGICIAFRFPFSFRFALESWELESRKVTFFFFKSDLGAS